MKPPKNYISYSQLCLFLEDREEYFNRYYRNIKREPNEKMQFGKLAHKVLEDRTFIVSNLTDKQNKIIEKIRTEIPITEQCEVKIEVEYKPINLLAIFDGIQGDTIVEYKTGQLWNQKRVDEHLQLTFYSLVYWSKYKKMPRLKLISISSASGAIRTFWTARTYEDIKDLQDKINYFYSEIKSWKG